MRSPSTTRRMRSNGSIELSSRRPTTRVSSRRKKNATAQRRAMSTALGEHGHGAGHGEDGLSGVRQRDALRATAYVRRIDLELQVDDERVSGTKPPVCKRQ